MSSNALAATALSVLALALIVIGGIFAKSKDAEAWEAFAQDRVAEVSEELDVEVIDYNVHGSSDDRFMDIQTKDDETLRCEFPVEVEFDGELKGCFDFTTVPVSSDSPK